MPAIAILGRGLLGLARPFLVLCSLYMDPLRQQRVLRQHVKTDALLGIDVVPVSDRVIDVPNIAPQGGAMVPDDAAESLAPPHGVIPQTPPRGSLFVAPAAPRTTLDREAKLNVLQAMDTDEVKPCRKCGLCEGRTNTVFGEGDADAKLMFIGEGPGQTEDETGRPFVGKAGELLDKMIVAMGLTREQVYIANVVKCRPPNNRAPLPTEVDACWDYLRRQVEAINPRVIVTLGGPATNRILMTEKGITAIRGAWSQCTLFNPPIPVMPTFHPAFLLRSYTPDNRKKVWADLQQVMGLLKNEG